MVDILSKLVLSMCSSDRDVQATLVLVTCRVFLGGKKFSADKCLFKSPMFSSNASFNQLQLRMSLMVAGGIFGNCEAVLMQ